MNKDYEEFKGKVLKSYGCGMYEVEVDGGTVGMTLLQLNEDLRINPGAHLIFYGKRKSYGKKEEIKEVFYLKLLGNDGKIIAEYTVPYRL